MRLSKIPMSVALGLSALALTVALATTTNLTADEPEASVLITSVTQDPDSGEVFVHGTYGPVTGNGAVTLSSLDHQHPVTGAVSAVRVRNPLVYQYSSGEFTMCLGRLPHAGNYLVVVTYIDASDDEAFAIGANGVLVTN